MLFRSLMGYDEILLDKYVEQEYKNKMIGIFKNYIQKNYGSERWALIKLISSSLVFSLIPLHDNEKTVKYYSMIEI